MYHWRAEQMKRNSMAKRFTTEFVIQEQNDRNDRTQYPVMPSPLGKYWLCYIHHRLKMLKDGISAYTTRKYTRLDLDKHINSYRAIDQVAGMLTNYQPSIVFFGNGETPPNSPIKIKKHVKCPGSRKLINAFKKRGNCTVIPTDEYYTSQTCGRCFGRFDVRTKKDKFKVCQDCHPRQDAMLPSLIVTHLGKRDLQEFRKIHRQMAADLNEPVTLLAKVKTYHKIWQMNRETGEIVNAAAEDLFDFQDDLDADAQRQIPHKTIWHRDIVAAKCILIKGIYELHHTII